MTPRFLLDPILLIEWTLCVDHLATVMATVTAMVMVTATATVMVEADQSMATTRRKRRKAFLSGRLSLT